MRTINQILSVLKKTKQFRTDVELATYLGVKANTLATWKARNTIPYDLLVAKCEFEDFAVDWLLYEEEISARLDKKEGVQSLHKEEARPEGQDPALAEIMEMLEEDPGIKRAVLKLLRGKKEMEAGLAAFQKQMRLKTFKPGEVL